MNISSLQNQVPVVTNGKRQEAVSEKYDSLLSKLGFTSGKTGVLDGNGVNNLVEKDTSGVKGTAGSAPKITAPEDAASSDQSENIESVTSKLTSESVTRKTVMFDLYALMELMQEMAQEMRNAMRELRQTELTGIQANLQAQAAVQEKAAITQLCIGVAAGALQAVVSGIGTYKSVSGAKADVKLASDQTKLTAAKNDVELTTCLKDPGTIKDLSGTQLNSVQAETGLSKETVGDGLGNSNAALSSAEKVFSPEAELTERMDAYKNLTGQDLELTDLQVPNAEAGLNSKELKLSDKQVNAVVDALTQAFDKDLQTLASTPGGAKMGRAIQLQKTAAISDELGVSVADKVRMAGTQKVIDIGKGLGNMSDVQLAARKSQAWGGFSMQLGMLFGQVGQTIASSVGQNIQAEGTKLQAEKAAMEERLDQDKDLFANCMQIVEKAIQIFAAVTQAEASSIRDIMA